MERITAEEADSKRDRAKGMGQKAEWEIKKRSWEAMRLGSSEAESGLRLEVRRIEDWKVRR